MCVVGRKNSSTFSNLVVRESKLQTGVFVKTNSGVVPKLPTDLFVKTNKGIVSQITTRLFVKTNR